MRANQVVPLFLAAVLPLSGCAGRISADSPPPRPALINHVVFVSLRDPADADALIADCDARLRTVPSVVSYYAGRHVDTGRANVVEDYDVGIFVGFDSLEGYAEYVDHPSHVGLVNDWRARISALVVRDVVDPSE